MTQLKLALTLCLIFRWTQALATPFVDIGFDCTKSSNAMERRICTNPKLRKAEAQMNAAYFALLRSVKDSEMHGAIIMSQRRWIETRRRDLGSYSADYDPEDPEGLNQPIPLSSVIEQRKSLLTGAGAHGEPAMVSNMREQRRFLSRAPGGPFQGFITECFFAPKRFGLGGVLCTGSSLLQRESRVCGTSSYWATGTTYNVDFVADVKDMKMKIRASCKVAINCPGGKDGPGSSDEGVTLWTPEDGSWSMNPKPTSIGLVDKPIQHLDPDIDPYLEFSDSSLNRCLNEMNYPPSP